jgi:hypothetical protein
MTGQMTAHSSMYVPPHLVTRHPNGIFGFSLIIGSPSRFRNPQNSQTSFAPQAQNSH